LDQLERCLMTYNSMMRSRFRMTLEGGVILRFHFEKGNLRHLLGLQKLTDLPELTRSSGSQVYKMLASGQVNYRKLRSSARYHLIEDRVEYFHLLPMLPYGKVVVDFDRTLLDHTELVNTRYILYQRQPQGVVHLTLAERRVDQELRQYPETFFFDSRNRYLSGQRLLDVVKLEVEPL